MDSFYISVQGIRAVVAARHGFVYIFVLYDIISACC